MIISRYHEKQIYKAGLKIDKYSFEKLWEFKYLEYVIIRIATSIQGVRKLDLTHAVDNLYRIVAKYSVPRYHTKYYVRILFCTISNQGYTIY